MKKGKRILIALTALVLLVVSALVAVTAILSATKQNIGSSLSAKYIADNVKAEVKVEYAKIAISDQPVTISKNSYSTATGTAKTSFAVTQHTIQSSVVAPLVTLGFQTGESGDTFYRGVVYRFTIVNKYATIDRGCSMTVKAQYTKGAYQDEKILYAWAISEDSQDDLTITLPAEGSSATWATPTITGADSSGPASYLETERTLSSNVVQNDGLTCLYLVVFIKDTTVKSDFLLNYDNSVNTLIFTLTGNRT